MLLNQIFVILISLSTIPLLTHAESWDCCFTRNCTRVDFLTNHHPYNPQKNNHNKQPEQKDGTAGLEFLSMMHPLLANTNQCYFTGSFNCRDNQDLTECLPCCCETQYSRSFDTISEMAQLSGMGEEEWMEFNGYEGEPDLGDFVQVCNNNWIDEVVGRYARSRTTNGNFTLP